MFELDAAVDRDMYHINIDCLLVRGKINLFSLDCLMDMATAAGLEPHVTIKKPKVSRKRRNEELAAA